MSSLAEVARRAGVSKATASRALSGAAHVSPAAKNGSRQPHPPWDMWCPRPQRAWSPAAPRTSA